MRPEFKKFPKIERWEKADLTAVPNDAIVTIAQKMHGTNAQLYITEDEAIYAGSRTRWITPEDDNFGFAAWVQEHKLKLILTLGPGRHYGEWCGPGINSGEGLSDKSLYLFDEAAPYLTHYFGGGVVKRLFGPVPFLWKGIKKQLTSAVDPVLASLEVLKQVGSSAVSGYMHPEGIVIDVGGIKYKKTFYNEEASWKGLNNVKKPGRMAVDYSEFLQPLRLEKLLSRDERYIREYPESLVTIVKDYMADLKEEGVEMPPKASSYLFQFVKQQVNR